MAPGDSRQDIAPRAASRATGPPTRWAEAAGLVAQDRLLWENAEAERRAATLATRLAIPSLNTWILLRSDHGISFAFKAAARFQGPVVKLNLKSSHFLLVVLCVGGQGCSGGGGEVGRDTSMPADAGIDSSAVVDATAVVDTAVVSKRICLDEAHHNYHTLAGRYAPFGEELKEQGHVVVGFEHSFDANALSACDVLVIANALNQVNVSSWSLPTPSAFTEDEVAAVGEWVEGGGALFLIADHMPFPGAAEALAAQFGATFHNGFAINKTAGKPDIFSRGDSTLATNVITNGRNADERIEKVESFAGQAFDLPDGATPIVTLNSDYHLLLPETAWEFTPFTPRREAGGMVQAGFLVHGNGRVVLCGEAAMFTLQKGTGLPAADNRKLLLNIINWLTGQLDEK